jgi:hypothetical protein
LKNARQPERKDAQRRRPREKNRGLKIKLIDEAGNPVPGEAYKIKPPTDEPLPARSTKKAKPKSKESNPAIAK